LREANAVKLKHRKISNAWTKDPRKKLRKKLIGRGLKKIQQIKALKLLNRVFVIVAL